MEGLVEGLEDIPTEVITIILESLDSKSLCNAEAVSKRYKEATVDAWSSVYQRELPLFKHTKPDTAVSWKEHYVNTLGGKVESHVQIYDFGIYNMNVKDHLLSYNEDGQLQAVCIAPPGYANSGPVVITPDQILRVPPDPIKDLKPHALWVPEGVSSWDEYLKAGDEIELQWGQRVTHWWRGMVERIEGEKMYLPRLTIELFTHFHVRSPFYREEAIFGQEHGKCKGVRKVVEPEIHRIWEHAFEEAGLRYTAATGEDDERGIGV